MSGATSILDKTFDSSMDDLGSMTIRVVVLSKKIDESANDAGGEADNVPLDLGDDEVQVESGKTPTRGYLEDPKRGKECCVFLINGQRQDAWDNAFIVRDLDKKYLRNRMLVAVDLDGLKPEAVADLMSGDRQGFFQGRVYSAMTSRLVSTLKRDPDLERLEEDAERELSELRGGDEAVKQALDQLIDSHHAMSDHLNDGAHQPGKGIDVGKGSRIDREQNVVVPPGRDGVPFDGPYLTGMPASQVLRIYPSERTSLNVTAAPVDVWAETSELIFTCKPDVDGLKVERTRTDRGEKFSFLFEPPADFEDDQYPMEAAVSITAQIKGHTEVRLLTRRIVIMRKGKKKEPPKPPVLLDEPTFLKITSRQPVAIVSSDAATHVRLRWDGKDALAAGTAPKWQFSAACLTLPSFQEMSFSRPSGGRFELLIFSGKAFNLNETYEFEVTATGPNGKKMVQKLVCEVVEPPQAKKLKMVVPEPSAQRRPPYDLKYVDEANWDTGYAWNDQNRWTGADVGAFDEPSEKSPLTLIINEDMTLLKEYRDGLIAKKLEASTVKQRVNRYTSHVAFHLYQMYLNGRDAKKSGEGENISATFESSRGEINRVGATLLKVMAVMQ